MSSLYRPLPSYRRQGSTKRLMVGILVVIVGFFLASSVLQCTLLNSVMVRSVSMEPSIRSGDIILSSPVVFGKTIPFSNKSILDFAQPHRGDLVLVRPPYSLDLPFFQKMFDGLLSFVTLGHITHRSFNSEERSWEASSVYRRVIALPGDELYMTDAIFYVRPKGKQDFLEEQRSAGVQYQPVMPKVRIPENDMVFSDEMTVMTVPPHSCFVAADNRSLGMDSRNWGVIDIGDLRGQALVRYWPPSRFGLVR